MAFTVEQFRREVRQEILEECTVEERLRGLPVEERLRGLSPTEIRGMSPQMREQLLALLLTANAEQNGL